MAEIPSDIPSSAAQAGYKAGEEGRARAARGAAQASAANRQIKAVNEAGATVDTEDADTQIFADAEGGGSQGRAFEEGSAPETEEADHPGNGIARGKDGQLHLDLEA